MVQPVTVILRIIKKPAASTPVRNFVCKTHRVYPYTIVLSLEDRYPILLPYGFWTDYTITMSSSAKHSQLVLLFASVVFVAGLSAFIGYRVASQTADSKATPFPTSTQPPKPSDFSDQSTLVFIRNNNVWIKTSKEEKQLTEDGVATDPTRGLPAVYYRKPVLSPDKSFVAYIRSTGDATDKRSLEVASVASPIIRKKISPEVDWALDSIAWKRDSSGIYFVSQSQTDYDTKYINLAMIASGVTSKIGSFGVQSGCGGGSSDPADHLTWKENISGWPVTFTLSPDETYIVHNSNCTGRGLSIFDLTRTTDHVLDTKNTGASFAGNGKVFASYSGNSITIFDARTKTALKSFTAAGPVSSILFSPDGQAIFYTITERIKTVTVDDENIGEVLGFSPAEFAIKKTILHNLTLATGISSAIAAFDAHDARPMMMRSKDQEILLAVIDNATALYTYLTTQQSKADVTAQFPTVSIVSVHIKNGITTPLVSNAEQASY